MKQCFFVEGRPKGKERPRFANGRAYTPRKTSEYEKLIALSWRKWCRIAFPETAKVRVRVTAQFHIPRIATKRDRAFLAWRGYPHKPDADNVLKCVLDALNGVAYKDDACVVDVACRKVYAPDGEPEGIMVSIEEVE